MTPIMDIDVSSPMVQRRDVAGRRDVDEWGLKVQKMANVFSVTLVFVSLHQEAKLILVGCRNGCTFQSPLCRIQG